jgi:uncharacterized protein (DUF1501 family)
MLGDLLREGIDRRTFLSRTMFGLGAALIGPQAFLRLARAEPLCGDETILVVVQLSGGNDGLATVVPHGDDAYYRVRRTIAIGAKEAVRLDDYHGLHPGLAPLRKLWDDGRFAIVQGASYPNPNRSHFKSMDIWQAASLEGRRASAGWLGRAVDWLHPDEPSPSLMVSIGRTTPFALSGKINKPIAFVDPKQARALAGTREEPICECKEHEAAGPAPTVAEQEAFLRRVASDARVASQKMGKALEGYRPGADYPGGRLAQSLRTIAALIAGRLEARVFYAELGGFDTHTTQRGRHDGLMRELGAGLAAFQADLDAHGVADRVALVTFSEFGRRVAENASGGTDHGVAGPMLLIGAKVRGGLASKHPSLTDLDAGDLKMTTDFRSVYATLLEDWLGVPSKEVLGAAFAKLPLIDRAKSAPPPRPAKSAETPSTGRVF